MDPKTPNLFPPEPDPMDSDPGQTWEDMLDSSPFADTPLGGPRKGGPPSAGEWMGRVSALLASDADKPLDTAMEALDAYPTDSRLLLLGAYAALREEKADMALRLLKRMEKWYVPTTYSLACKAIALAHAGRWPVARNLVEQQSLTSEPAYFLFPPGINARSGAAELRRIARWQPDQANGRKNSARKAKRDATRSTAAAPRDTSPPAPTPIEPPVAADPGLPRPPPAIALDFRFPDAAAYPASASTNEATVSDYLLRRDFLHMSMLRGFDELLCLSAIHGVESHLYQEETVRKVLRQFRGRVLLADEVGLGKTIEAGMVAKEYLLRGMIERILVLVPPSLVGQWQEELAAKFDIHCRTTNDPGFRSKPDALWRAPLVIASIATARSARHADALAREAFDLVIVDEAHHLKNRSSLNWKLVNRLNKRFLLLLSATPVENSLIEIHNLLTLLRPGVCKTLKEFRASYMTPGNPRKPLNADRLRDLMRDVMIRNTRSLVDIPLPPRHAVTCRVPPTPDEAECYETLCRLVTDLHTAQPTGHRLALRHLLEAAGSSPAAAAASLDTFLHNSLPPAWQELRDRYARVTESAKTRALLEIVEKNPSEKKLVFVRHTPTLAMLTGLLEAHSLPHAEFHGGMTGTQKDDAVARFQADVPILLCTESGGEGRNLQFCNTLINFDLPWNPQAIEQRIGRIHRIGQQRDVFIFNLAITHTLEDRMLAILEEKLNMFQLVVGEMQSILGELDDETDFANLVFSAWVQTTHENRPRSLDAVAERLGEARTRYDQTRAYDQELFANDFEAL